MQSGTGIEQIQAASEALRQARGSGWQDPIAANQLLAQAITHLRASLPAAAAGRLDRAAGRAEVERLGRELRVALAGHKEAARVCDGLLRVWESGLALEPGSSYGADGARAEALSGAGPGLRIAVEG